MNSNNPRVAYKISEKYFVRTVFMPKIYKFEISSGMFRNSSVRLETEEDDKCVSTGYSITP